MALRMGALYDALRQAQGIDEDDAKRAAEEVANYENRLHGIERDLNLVKWMLGTVVTIVVMNLAGTIAVLYRLSGSR
jgi:hypothetical protein